MCYNPVKVSTESRMRYYSSGQSLVKANNIVPCGKCAQCVNQKQTEWFVRTKAECASTLSQGGKVLFLTFTYREEDVPLYTWDYFKGILDIFDITGLTPQERPTNCFMAFDHRHFRNYLKSVRKVFERAGFTKSFKYIICSEYGTDIHCTQRPHYHVLFFLPKGIYEHILEIVQSSRENHIVGFFAKYWKYGFVSKSKKGLFVTGDRCARYVSKYVTKDLNYYNNPGVKAFINTIPFDSHYFSSRDIRPVFGIPERFRDRFEYYLNTKDSCKLAELYCMINRATLVHYGIEPRHFQSEDFGISLRDYITVSDSYDNMIDRYEQGVSIVEHGVNRTVPYPRYIKNKLMYDTRKDGTLSLNQFGRYYKISTVRKRITELKDSYLELLKRDFSTLSTETLKQLNDAYKERPKELSLTTRQDVFNFYFSLVSKPNFAYRCAVYSCLFHGTYVCGFDKFVEVVQFLDTITENSELSFLDDYVDDSFVEMEEVRQTQSFFEFRKNFFGQLDGEYYPVDINYHTIPYQLFVTLFRILSNDFNKSLSEYYSSQELRKKQTKDIINLKCYKHA